MEKLKGESSKEELTNMVNSKIELGTHLFKQMELFTRIEGSQKIQRKINHEIKFLEKVKKSGKLKLHHILCSNLVHYDCLVNALFTANNIKHIDYPIPVPHRKSPLRIDIVSDHGGTWIKVVARNPKSLSDSAYGRSGFGTKTILDQAEEYIETAKDNKYFFNPPKVIFQFAHQIEEELINELKSIGVIINIISKRRSSIIDGNVEQNSSKDGLNDFNSVQNIDTLNLDVTTMLAYVSAMTNGSCDWEYVEPVLTQLATWERNSPVKPILDSIFKDKRLICCVSASTSFNEIIETLGGCGERKRAEEFIKRIEVFPDVPELPEEMQRLNIGGKIKPRSLAIFSFGICQKALTVTANEGFIRSSRMQGIDIPSFVHEARPLSEQKELRAKQLNQQ